MGSGGFAPNVLDAVLVLLLVYVAMRDSAGEHDAVAIDIDPELDLAVLAVPGVGAPPIAWASDAVGRGAEGANLGLRGGRSEMVVRPATVVADLDTIGLDIYGRQPRASRDRRAR